MRLDRLTLEECERIAEHVAQLHSPAGTDYDKGALHAAEVIAAKIRARRLEVTPAVRHVKS